MRAAIKTFGCKVNQYESEAVRHELEREGYAVVDGGDVDLQVVNTCTVTEEAARDALRLVRRLGRRHPGRRIRVIGCAAKTHREQFARLPGVEAVIPHDPGQIHRQSIRSFEGHTRAFVKIQDGCDLRCSFCIIPSVRGGSVARGVEPILQEVRDLRAAGYREIVLTGVHLGGFPDLAGLVVRLRAIGVERVRLSSIEVNEVNDRLIELVCPHFHLPLQSGDDSILRSMRRRYNSRQFMATVDRLRSRLPDVGLSTDVIVGYPGEDRPAFERTVDLCKRAGFMRIHVFPYSPGPADPGRVRELKALGRDQAHDFARRFVGRDVTILVQSGEEGYTEHYVPARLPGGVRGALVTRRAIAADEGVLSL